MYLLITYDISNNKNRNKIDKLLSSYGYRVNFSVFELEVKQNIYTKIVGKLLPFMERHDSIRVYKLDKNSASAAIELNSKLPTPFHKDDSYV